MKFLSHIRSRSRLKSQQNPHPHGHSRQISHPFFHDAKTSFRPNPTARFPPRLLEELLAYVCPHSRDESYTPSEESMLDGGCMLCDLRDLAHCAAVNRQWNEAGQNVLYHSVRIDAVHYCDREYELAQRRKRRSFNNRNGDARDPAQERLMLLSRTVRENNFLAGSIFYLKTPYMMRESCKADLARTVSVLPNLRYVDLPDSFYTDSSATSILRSELQARCPDIRKMKYMEGAEETFVVLAQGRVWQSLECLELNGLVVEPSTLGFVLSSLSALREVLLVDLPTLDNESMGSLPPIASITLKETPYVSIEGIANYFSHPGVDQTLTSLTLTNTAILASTLNQILASAPRLTHLALSEATSRAFPVTPPPPLASKTLKTLHYEITTLNSSQRGATPPSESYYAYLASSIHSGGLPLLTHLYALSTNLPTLLLSPTSHHPHNSTLSPAPSQPTSIAGIQTTLNIYTKSISELEWNLTLIHPPNRQRKGDGGSVSASETRPLSLYHHPELSPQWRSAGRESVMVGNGFGGYLMVPAAEREDVRDRGTGSKETSGAGGRSPRRKERDAWMG